MIPSARSRVLGRTVAQLLAISAATSGLFASTASAADAPARSGASVGLIEIKETPGERPAPLAHIFGSQENPTLRELVALIDDAGDGELDALVIRLRDADLGTTQVEEIGRAIARVREQGKKVHLFADSYGTSEVMLGAYCDEVILQSGGDVTMPGLYMEEMYLADTFNWVGIKPDYVQVGDYKGASEPMSRSGPSPQWDQNINQLLDSMYANVRSGIKAGRRLDDARLDAAMEQAIMAGGDIATRTGLVDTVLDLPTLNSHLEKAYGGDIDWTNLTESDGESAIDMQNPFALLSKLMKPASNRPRRDTIAVLHVNGPIVDGDSSSGGLMGSESVGSHTIRRALQELEDNDKIKGVVIRIDSPGGSATASESMWLGVRRVAENKPVWVSIGSMAASGGYYVAVSGSRIFVNPSSIVGSIGVVGGKLALGGAYDKLKLRVVPRSRGPMGGLLGSTSPWTEAERTLIRTRMTETYDLFTSRVTAGRQGIDLSTTAEGRLFTGSVAIGNNMADEIGGLTEAVRELAEHVGLQEGAYDVLDYPPAPGLAEILENVMGAVAAAPDIRSGAAGDAILAGAISLLREFVGPRAWPGVRDHIAAMLELRRERVLLVSPRALIFR
jgi:protease IV